MTESQVLPGLSVRSAQPHCSSNVNPRNIDNSSGHWWVCSYIRAGDVQKALFVLFLASADPLQDLGHREMRNRVRCFWQFRWRKGPFCHRQPDLKTKQTQGSISLYLKTWSVSVAFFARTIPRPSWIKSPRVLASTTENTCCPFPDILWIQKLARPSA